MISVVFHYVRAVAGQMWSSLTYARESQVAKCRRSRVIMLICMFAEPIRWQKVFKARVPSDIGPPKWSILFVGVRIC